MISANVSALEYFSLEGFLYYYVLVYSIFKCICQINL
jgi:hypothetical protein